MKLSGWVLSSTLWFPIGFWWGNNVGMSQGNPALRWYDLCTTLEGIKAETCTTGSQDLFAIETAYHLWFAWAYALLPIAAGWILPRLILRIVRWVRQGFMLANTNPPL